MHHAKQLEQLRQFVHERFGSMAAQPAAETHETILIQDGCYCGRRFDCDGLRAIWFAEENQIKFFDREGHVVDKTPLAPVANTPESQVA